jgi:pimeloyl-ACP methyl ester carboxylesterase
MTTPTVDGSFAVDGKRSLTLRCWGMGSPVIVYDAGSGTGGLSLWPTRSVMTEMARTNQVCTYDRAGLGESDPAPNRKRVLDDAVHDLAQLLAAAKVAGPYILVGSSGGGFNVYQHAGRFPKEVAGLVMLDVPRGQAKMSAEDVKALAWDAPGNPEHMDYVAIERQMALHRLPIRPIPVTVITADAGQSATNPDEQKIWLTGSSNPVHIVLSGGHDIYDDNPPGSHRQNPAGAQAGTGRPLRQHVPAAAGGQVRPTALLRCNHPLNIIGGQRRMRASRASARRAWPATRAYPSTRSSYIHLR